MNEQLPPVTETPKKNNTVLIVAIVSVVVLCCCCIGLYAAWTYGDAILQSLNISF